MIRSTPIIKWAGGKQKLLPHIMPHMPESCTAYVEPFLGGASVLCAVAESVKARTYVAADACAPLVNLYKAVQASADTVRHICLGAENNYNALGITAKEKYYYDCRNRLNILAQANSIGHNTVHAYEMAALFMIINAICFNGLWRTNRNNECNVPWGKRDSLALADTMKLEAFSKALNKVEIRWADWTDTITYCEPGSVLYLDPPYAGGFTSYNGIAWNYEDQSNLAQAAAKLAEEGTYVVVSNRATPEMISLWESVNAKIHIVDFIHSMGRNTAKEMIATLGDGP